MMLDAVFQDDESPSESVREGWAEAFTKMAESGDDLQLQDVAMSQSDWDQTEWEW